MLAFDILWLGVAAAVVLVLLCSLLVVNRLRAADRQQEKLTRAFARASRVQGAGTGEQGKPYSLYGPRSWNDR